MIWDNDVSGCRFESGGWSESIIKNIHMWILSKDTLIETDATDLNQFTNSFRAYTVYNTEITLHLIFTIWDQHTM